MKLAKHITAALLGLLALAVAVFTVKLCFYALDAEPVILNETPDPGERAAIFMDCICERDYDRAYGYLEGGDLGLETEPASDLGKVMHEALLRSLSYELNGEAEISGLTARQSVILYHLDIPALAEEQKEHVEAVLMRYVEEAEDRSTVVDEDGNYRAAAGLQALIEVTKELLKDPEPYMTETELVLTLSYVDQEWKISADSSLYEALSGNTY